MMTHRVFGRRCAPTKHTKKENILKSLTSPPLSKTKIQYDSSRLTLVQQHRNAHNLTTTTHLTTHEKLQQTFPKLM